jgi:hypothetical protein
MVDVFLVVPNHSEIIDHECETNGTRCVPEASWCAWYLRISVFKQMGEQSLLA